MSFEAKVIAHSISTSGKEIVTLQLRYPRFVHAEFMTHRVFSRNASSSRAIPVAKMIEQVRTDPAMPIHWGKNQPGMQAAVEHDEPILYHFPYSDEDDTAYSAPEAWRIAANHAADVADAMNVAGYHKQVVNRILEPFQWISVVVTATEWGNFFELRDHPDAQPEIRHLAQLMKQAIENSEPRLLRAGEWHAPYVSVEEQAEIRAKHGWRGVIRVSAARCCRVSYLKHDGTHASFEEDMALCDRLAASKPIHASPFEHQAEPDSLGQHALLWGNLVGWLQHRKLLELEVR